MGIPDTDIFLTSSLLGGKATCVFRPKPYHRTITSIVVTNTLSGTVNAYRGLIGGFVVGTNLLGSNNTLRGPISLPAGQALFVQWENAGAGTARMSAERVDNPLDSEASSGVWATDAVTFIQLPSGALPDDAAILIGEAIPPCLAATYSSVVLFRPKNTVSLGAGAAPYKFIGQTKSAGTGSQEILDEGFLLYDGGAICGYVVTRTEIWDNNADFYFDSHFAFIVGAGLTFPAGAGPVFQYGSQTGSPPTTLDISAKDGSRIPDLARLTIDGIPAPRGFRDGNAATAGNAIATSNGAEVAIPSASYAVEPTFDFYPEQLYRVVLSCAIAPDAANNTTASIKIRKGAATVVGTVLCNFQAEMIDQAFFNLATKTFVGYITYATGVYTGPPVSTKLSITIQKLNGAPNAVIWADANNPLHLSVEHIGDRAHQLGLQSGAGTV